jgi:hypothetical protein
VNPSLWRHCLQNSANQDQNWATKKNHNETETVTVAERDRTWKWSAFEVVRVWVAKRRVENHHQHSEFEVPKKPKSQWESERERKKEIWKNRKISEFVSVFNFLAVSIVFFVIFSAINDERD